jgi:hypothetical protein
MTKHSTKLNDVARNRKKGDATRKAFPKASGKVTGRAEIGVQSSAPDKKANIKR